MVEPCRLVSVGRRWYLLGCDTDRQDSRTYRVDRLRPRIPSGPGFAPSGGVAAFVTQGFSLAPYACQTKATVEALIIEVAEGISPAAGYPEAIDERLAGRICCLTGISCSVALVM
ncbi:WYL domain-containing protein [Mycobacteroides chelonae]|uniref:WYL domain-containing protein n=1 Tax=Mycobacteroides chelonae TaxID=1774 RepID=UPI0009BF5F3E|nr:WYL domain-containing protein [Mycobacteroides chelonae]MBF9350391.1 WYL domain-containing protein [Mycobacteroides chelonae]